MTDIIPSILTTDIKEVEALLAESAQVGDRVHIDIIDGTFADNTTIDPSVMAGIDTTLDFDFHLMTKEPLDWVAKCVNAFADRIFGQIEEMSDQMKFLEEVHRRNLDAGLAIDLETDTAALKSETYAVTDAVLIMSVKAGFGGQEFEKIALKKIGEVNDIRQRDSLNFKICVDGGITPDNIGKVVEAGADQVVIGGNRLFKRDLSRSVSEFKDAISGVEGLGE